MRNKRNTALNELGLIEYCKKVFVHKRSLIRQGIGDDTAVIALGKNKYLLFTCDMLIEGKHFKKTDALVDIGWKALSCSVSDIAAMGGEPYAALVSLGIPKKWRLRKVQRLYRGIQKAAKRFSVDVIGGDTNASNALIVDIAMIGFVKRTQLVVRSGAKAGDFLFVTGHLGGSLYGRHLRFMPRLREARFLQERVKLNAMIDISDGLVIDLWRMLQASKVGTVLFKSCIPLHADARRFEEALYMGEDFELLFTVNEKDARRLLGMIAKKKINFPVSFIGKIIKEKNKMYLFEGSERGITTLPPKGFLHF